MFILILEPDLAWNKLFLLRKLIKEVWLCLLFIIAHVDNLNVISIGKISGKSVVKWEYRSKIRSIRSLHEHYEKYVRKILGIFFFNVALTCVLKVKF